MFGECHAHVFMDGVNYREAVRRQERGVREDWIRHVFEQYVKNEIFYVREGGDLSLIHIFPIKNSARDAHDAIRQCFGLEKRCV